MVVNLQFFGGRGGSSGIAGTRTAQQSTKINNITRAGKKYGYKNLKFTMDKDGVVNYSFETTRIVNKVHNSKMQDPSKNDIYERTEYNSGKIFKDGLIKKNKAEKNERLIKKGKR